MSPEEREMPSAHADQLAIANRLARSENQVLVLQPLSRGAAFAFSPFAESLTETRYGRKETKRMRNSIRMALVAYGQAFKDNG